MREPKVRRVIKHVDCSIKLSSNVLVFFFFCTTIAYI